MIGTEPRRGTIPASHIPILSLLRGQAQPFAKGKLSAIAKSEIDGPIYIGPLGLEGDEQADPRNHGGPEKAVHHYAHDHYATWRTDLTHDDASRAVDELFSRPGAFGENLSTRGLTEEDVCIGDLWRTGTVLLEVSQARQPCWKLNERFGVADMARRVQTRGRTGWYYRVREAGLTETGNPLVLVDRPHPDWPLSRILRAFYFDLMDRSTLEGIAALNALASSWRDLARRRLEGGRVEDWTRRLTGQDAQL